MGIWKNQPSVAELNALSRNALMESLGIRFLGIEGDTLKAVMPVDGRTKQPYGLLHGGASAALAETLGSTASHLCIDPETHFSVGLELNANHVRAKREGQVTGIASPFHIGRTTHIWQIRISDESDRLICISRLTTVIREKKQALA